MIYLVDDDEDLVKLISLAAPDDWDLKTFTSPIEALKEIAKDRPLIVISDVMMPGVNGLQFFEIARNMSNAPIVIISANSKDGIESNFGKMPSDNIFFQKPLERDFYGKISELIAKRREEYNYYKDFNTSEANIKSYKGKVEELFNWMLFIIKKSMTIDQGAWRMQGVLRQYDYDFQLLETYRNGYRLSEAASTRLKKFWGMESVYKHVLSSPSSIFKHDFNAEPIIKAFFEKEQTISSSTLKERVGKASFKEYSIEKTGSEFVLLIDGVRFVPNVKEIPLPEVEEAVELEKMLQTLTLFDELERTFRKKSYRF